MEDDRTPYPGLAAFTEADAEFFFGREAEVAQMWRKLTSRRLLAVIGPSGVGKSSFLWAGLLPAAPVGWGTLVCQPGEGPFASLARALAPEFEGDPEAISNLVDIGDETAAVAIVSRWRERHTQALLVVDQFEELFTLNPPEVQERFAELLARLARDADVHVLLSMRDDFLYRCHDHDALMPIFSELTPVKVPSPEDLRRALVQPAARLGYSFDDDGLADEMLEAVTGERGALPMLAFAVARLWEKRDTEKKELTRSAYQGIGGVSGALAQHAESTLTTIGQNRLPIVRELFRNLITAEGTRATREVENLLSVFPEPRREEAEQVLRRLIDARLLTSFEEEAVEGNAGHHRVEVVHESLLSSWPRLVGWQTQDADSARLRDELRQAARMWEDHDRSSDYLWTGKAYREFSVWWENYPGGLTDTEEEFGDAMTAHSKRRRRRWRIAVAAAFLVLLAVLGIVGVSRQQAIAEANRAEAQKLITLGQLELQHPTESDPTKSLSYALASLVLADTEEARLLALKALWKRPPRLQIRVAGFGLDFSPDGRQLAVGSRLRSKGEEILIWASNGGSPTLLRPENPGESYVPWVRFAAEPGHLFSSTGFPGHGAQMWSLPDMSLLRSFECVGRRTSGRLSGDGRQLVTWTESDDRSRITLRAWPLPEGDPIVYEDLPLDGWPDIDPTGTWIAYPTGTDLHRLPLGNLGDRTSVPFARHDHPILSAVFDQQGTRIASADDSGEVRVWSMAESPARLLRSFQSCPRSRGLEFSHEGSLLAVRCNDRQFLWDLDGPPEAAPLELAFDGSLLGTSFDPRGRWIAATHFNAIGIWPLDRRYPSVLLGHAGERGYVVFAPDGTWLGSAAGDTTIRLWPLSSKNGLRGRVLFSTKGNGAEFFSLAVTPDGQSLVAGTNDGEIWMVPVNGGNPRLVGRSNDIVQAIAISPDGRTIATGGGYINPAERVIRLWDLDSGLQRQIDPGDEGDVSDLEFMRDGRLLSASGGTLRRWTLEDDSSEVLMEGGVRLFDLSADEDSVLFRSGGTWGWGSLHYLSLVKGESHDLPLFGPKVTAVAFDPTGTIAVTGVEGGIVQVGLASGGDTQLLFGHHTAPWSVAVSPDGHWIASGSQDTTVRLWPMPDLSKPPLHTLPREELIAKLKTLTNLRVVRDDESATGWKLTVGPFPGWETVPSW